METKQSFEQKGGYYLISSAQDLLQLSNSPEMWDKDFLQTSDINMEGITDFSPIGNTTNTFTGTYDGQNYGIYNLVMDYPGRSYVALFGINNGGKLQNICLKSGSIHAANLAGGICGDNAGTGIISGCYNGADISVEVDAVGGIVGCIVADALVLLCENTGTIKGKGTLGGIVGYSNNNSSVRSCCNMGKISAETEVDVDEICGKKGGSVIDCRSDHSIIEFDDADFKKYLVDNFDKDGDGEISVGEAKRVEHINFELWAPQRGDVKSVKGIEYFTYLKSLNCSNHHISELNLSQNEDLVDLWCHDNDLKSLDLSKNNKLLALRCWSNPFTTLDVSKNPELDIFYCNNIPSLTKVFIAKGQTIRDVIKDAHTEFVEVDSPEGKLYAELSAEVRTTHWQKYYKAVVAFSEGDKRYAFFHSSADKRWFMSELSTGWDLQSECKNGNWQHFYEALVPFKENGKNYLLAHSDTDKRWFISDLSTPWDGYSEITAGTWCRFFKPMTTFVEDGKTYVFGQSVADNKWFISELSTSWDGQSEVKHEFWARLYEVAVTFTDGNKNYIFGHSKTDKRWYLSELSTSWDGQSTVKTGDWQRFYSSVAKFEKDGKSYLFAHSNEDHRWFISELSANWDGQSEIGNGQLDNFYGTVFTYEKDGKIYLCGHSENDKSVFIREINIGYKKD